MALIQAFETRAAEIAARAAAEFERSLMRSATKIAAAAQALRDDG